MSAEEKIDIDLFKVVFRAIAQSDNLEIMANHLTQLLVAALEIKGCTIFALNLELDELEVLASFGLSTQYVHKGPVLSDKSMADTSSGKPFVISDVKNTNKLQYPEDAAKEGIGAIVSVPINFSGKIMLYDAYRSWRRSQAMVKSRVLQALLTISRPREQVE